MEDRFVIELEEGRLLAAIDRAIDALSDTGGLMEDIGAKLEANAQLRFETKTDPTGAPWKPLSQNTIDIWYAEKYPDGIPGSLLERTGLLRASLAHNSGDGWLELGTSRSVPGKSQPTWQIGMLMETGTTIMPRRGILTADPDTGKLGSRDEADLLAIVGGYLGDLFA